MNSVTDDVGDKSHRYENSGFRNVTYVQVICALLQVFSTLIGILAAGSQEPALVCGAYKNRAGRDELYCARVRLDR